MFQKQSSDVLYVTKWRLLSSLSSPAVAVQGQYNVPLWILKNILCYFDPEPLKKNPRRLKLETDLGPRNRNQDFILLKQAP